MIDIRTMTHRDIRTLCDYDPVFKSIDLHEILTTRDVFVKVVEFFSQPVGFLAYYNNKDFLTVHTIGCLPKHLDAVMYYMEDRNRRVIWHVRETELDTLNYLKARGYRANGISKNFYNPHDAYVMVRNDNGAGEDQTCTTSGGSISEGGLEQGCSSDK